MLKSVSLLSATVHVMQESWTAWHHQHLPSHPLLVCSPRQGCRITNCASWQPCWDQPTWQPFRASQEGPQMLRACQIPGVSFSLPLLSNYLLILGRRMPASHACLPKPGCLDNLLSSCHLQMYQRLARNTPIPTHFFIDSYATSML